MIFPWSKNPQVLIITHSRSMSSKGAKSLPNEKKKTKVKRKQSIYPNSATYMYSVLAKNRNGKLIHHYVLQTSRLYIM